ncbi:hypothetical protein NDU88_011840 [Pleurodeles waltl]|uniref:Uncharacterized protein n=1 Tax=Pleurodeles waltl TaxID=8319 RepID=A0AAV7R095_PLEWA|nr:hypothetical protein NDU88_011840 [Pleurodeles waltl]
MAMVKTSSEVHNLQAAGAAELVDFTISGSPVPILSTLCQPFSTLQRDKGASEKRRPYLYRGKSTTVICKWPSPFDYPQISTLGPHQPSRRGNPCFSIGGTWNPIPDNHYPAPNEYEKALASEKVGHTSPSFSIYGRTNGTYLWPNRELTPGPGTYNVEKGFLAVKPRARSFYIHGERGVKRHELGPFACL